MKKMRCKEETGLEGEKFDHCETKNGNGKEETEVERKDAKESVDIQKEEKITNNGDEKMKAAQKQKTRGGIKEGKIKQKEKKNVMMVILEKKRK